MGFEIKIDLKKIEFDGKKAVKNHHLDLGGEIQKMIDSEVLRLCDPLVPFDTGALLDSGISHTKIGSGEVIYQTPYARRQYYIPMTHYEGRTDYWFEHMKRRGGKDSILKKAKAMLK